MKLAYDPETGNWEVQWAVFCHHPDCEVGYHWVWFGRTENRDTALAMLGLGRQKWQTG